MDKSLTTSRPTVIYDGTCHFCVDRINNMRKLDSEGALEFLPRNDKQAEERFPHIKDMNFERGMLLIKPDMETFNGADAVFEIASYLPAFRNWVFLYKIPPIKWIARLGYAVIAANRKRLGKICPKGHCTLPE